MALPVVTNISSLNAQRNLQSSTKDLQKSLERLSSGLRINRAGDDAAGLAISEGLRSQIRGLNQAVRNANDGLSLIGTAEGAINSYTEILQRLRELAVQSANDTNSASNRSALNQEGNQLLEELQRISSTVEFNGTKLLDGSFTSKQLQVGAQANQTIEITTGDLSTTQIGMIAQKTGSAVPASAALNAGDLNINGVSIDAATSDNLSTINPDGSAIAIANAINAKTAEHNVTAEALAAEKVGVTNVGGGTFDGSSEKLTINGIDIFDGSITILANDSDGTLTDAINAKANQTGVTASVNTGGDLILTSNDGRNIEVTTTGSIADELGLVGADGDLTNDVTGGKVKITSNEAIVVAGASPGKAGLSSTTYSLDANTAINNLSIATADGANTAIDMVDNALGQINEIRASLGAVTNRLEHTVNNLQAISENLAASDSRIRDADFAIETAKMTRNQILQQAGVSVLAQANTTTQSALKLLQG